jgi:hypothetical protein
MPRKITFLKKSCTICTEDQKRILFFKVVKKLSKSCQSCQKVAKKLPKVAKKVVKKLSKIAKKLPKN